MPLTHSLTAGLSTVAVSCLVLAAAGPVAATPPDRGNGHLVMVGGNLQEDAEILQRIVDLADPDGDGPRKARIALVTAAASPAASAEEAGDIDENNAAANGLYYASLFEALGAQTYAVPVDVTEDAFEGDLYGPDNADSGKVAAQVRRSTGVFFGGGDQMRYVRTLLDCAEAPDEAFTDCEDTKVLSAVRHVLDRGGVVSGVSAGTTIQQGADMVTGGDPYVGWRDGAAPGYFDSSLPLGYVPFGGFGFFEAGLMDSHFTTWARQARMVRLALDTGHDRAFGVDETTALVVDRAAGTGSVVGDHGVSMLDVSEADDDRTDGSVEGVRWTYLSAGDSVDLATGEVTAAPGSTAPAVVTAPEPTDDIWYSDYEMRDLARALVASGVTEAYGTTYEDDPTYVTTLVRDDRTRQWQTPVGEVSFVDLELRVSVLE